MKDHSEHFPFNVIRSDSLDEAATLTTGATAGRGKLKEEHRNSWRSSRSTCSVLSKADDIDKMKVILVHRGLPCLPIVCGHISAVVFGETGHYGSLCHSGWASAKAERVTTGH